jgi:hypothetical protein
MPLPSCRGSGKPPPPLLPDGSLGEARIWKEGRARIEKENRAGVKLRHAPTVLPRGGKPPPPLLPCGSLGEARIEKEGGVGRELRGGKDRARIWKEGRAEGGKLRHAPTVLRVAQDITTSTQHSTLHTQHYILHTTVQNDKRFYTGGINLLA